MLVCRQAIQGLQLPECREGSFDVPRYLRFLRFVLLRHSRPQRRHQPSSLAEDAAPFGEDLPLLLVRQFRQQTVGYDDVEIVSGKAAVPGVALMQRDRSIAGVALVLILISPFEVMALGVPPCD